MKAMLNTNKKTIAVPNSRTEKPAKINRMIKKASFLGLVLLLLLSVSTAFGESVIETGFAGHIQGGVDLSVFDNEENYKLSFADMDYTGYISTNDFSLGTTCSLRIYIFHDSGNDCLQFVPAIYITPWEFYNDGFYIKIDGNRYFFDAPQRNVTYLDEDGLAVFREMLNPDVEVKGQFFARSVGNGGVAKEEAFPIIQRFFDDCEKAGIQFTYSLLSVKPTVLTQFN